MDKIARAAAAQLSLSMITMRDKVKEICRHRFSMENVIHKLGRYTTRIFGVLVWAAVLWAFLTIHALPRQYVEYLLRRTPKPCIIDSVEIVSDDREAIINFLPQSWNESLSTGKDYKVVAVSNCSEIGCYEVLLLRQNALCLNIYEFKELLLLVNNTANNGSDEVSTESLAMGTVDILNILHPDLSTDLLDIPEGHFFALFLLLVVSTAFGVLAKWIFLPPLVGMIIAGFVLRNVPGIDFARQISNNWSSAFRNIALVLVLTRGGLSMDIKQLKRLKLAVLLLAFLPCLLEGAVDGLLGTFWLKLQWQFAFTLGYVVAAISPSVVVPTALNLQSQGFGQASGIPTLIVAAASMDVVICISLFGVFLGLAFSEGNIILDIFRAPIQIIIGLLYGIIFGFLLWIFPTKYFKAGSKVRTRFFLTLGLGLFSVFGSSRAVIKGSNLAGSGALGVLVLAFVASQGWDAKEKKEVLYVFYIVWQFFEPLLFGLIGAAMDLRFISSSLVGKAIGLIIVGLTVRITVSYIVVLNNKFSLFEMGFVAIAWIPKATVQAAIGSLALDIALMRNNNVEAGREVEESRQILTVAVLAIVLTAPLGALATSLLGPVLLTKASKEELDKIDIKPNQVQPSLPPNANADYNGVNGEAIALDSVIIEDSGLNQKHVIQH